MTGNGAPSEEDEPLDAIAIVGIGCRYPGANNLEEFWQVQREGRITITRFDKSELQDWWATDLRQEENFIAARGVLDDVDMFDAGLFGMYAREAALTDPQHRVFLEICLEALEQAGLDPARFPGEVGVFAGASMPTYLVGHVLGSREQALQFTSDYQLGSMDRLVGSLPDTLATRIAYKLDLRGPAMTVSTACSTSLTAINQACQSLSMYRCDAALAGGVSITFPQQRGYLHLEGGMGSRDGTCRPFDEEACGTVFSSGAGVVLLKRLEDALSDGDTIYAIIRGCGISNDGSGKAAFTAPSAEGQAKAIAAAIAEAGVDPSSIGYVELHGTATPLGDPIEFAGLVQGYGRRQSPESCLLGSAKANIGHTDAAAGVAGLIRATMALHCEEIPPLANFARANPHIDLKGSGFTVPTEPASWPRRSEPRRAGVSSFGVGGTNVHVILEEAPATQPRADADGLQILPISARTKDALQAQALALASYLQDLPGIELPDVARTLSEGRAEREERGAVVAASVEEAVRKLSAFPKAAVKASAAKGAPVVFMFPGQGSQYPGMGTGLYRSEPVYREWIDRGAEQLKTSLGIDIRELLFSDAPANEDEPHPIRSTVHAQPALFLTQYALAQLWRSRGIEPDAMIGHSVGELVAASISGVLSFGDGLALVARRAELMQSAEPGAMLGVRLSEGELADRLGPDVDLAAVNATRLCVAAGPFDAIAQLQTALEKDGVESRRLHTSHAFHSAMMDPVVEELGKLASTFDYAAPAIPYVSCVTGRWASAETSGNGEYWARHCRETVRFAAALDHVAADAAPILIEVGPGRTLATFAGQGLARERYIGTVSSMPDLAEAAMDAERFAEAEARLWAYGGSPDWSVRYGPEARKIPLPTYPFKRTRCWIDAPDATSTAFSTSIPSDCARSIPTFQSEAVAMNEKQSRLPRIGKKLACLIEELSGETIDNGDFAREFLELGFDSLFLGQVAARVQREFGTKITFRQLMGDFASIDALARHLDEVLPPEVEVESPITPAPTTISASPPAPGVISMSAGPAPLDAADLAATFQAQLQAMQSVIDKQLELLSSGDMGRNLSSVAPPPPVLQVNTPALPIGAASATLTSAEEPVEQAPRSRFRPFDANADRSKDALTDRQKSYVDSLVRQSVEMMGTSKRQTAKHRPHFADPRTAAGFRPEWKELVFPLVAQRSKGSKLWDLDGNEFVDLVNGYGQTAFGHSPDFVIEAVSAQMELGFAIGPQSPLAGEVAGRISRMVGLDRVTFCNTGSEAVMAAMRIARCVTGREKVVVFNHDYHGQFDEVLVKAGGKSAFSRALPIAPGIPPGSLSNMVVLPYGGEESLAWIKANAGDIAAVLVEPVQSRRPDFLPVEFLRQLRELATENDIAYIFDEVVTGFRTHPGGMQAVLGIRADLATYGKVIGGGMPVGILAGSARYMDALDGGAWEYGDGSVPQTAPTFFAGTFVRHPLVVAACSAVLDHLEEHGPELQAILAARTAGLVDRINLEFASRGIKLTVPSYSSWFFLDLASVDRLGALFFHQLRALGVHVIEGYPCFVTTAHSDADLNRIVAAIGQTLDALQDAGILVASEDQVGGSPSPALAGPRNVPLTEQQIEILLAAQISDQASCAFNESITLQFDGQVEPELLSETINAFVARHDAMRARIDKNTLRMNIAPELRISLQIVDAVTVAVLDTIKQEQAQTPFDLERAPLIRAILARGICGEDSLMLTAHHMIFDGWTANLFASEVAEIYRALAGGQQVALPAAASFADYAEASPRGLSSEALAYWQETYAKLPPPLELPSDRPRPLTRSYAGATVQESVDAELLQAVKSAGRQLGCSLFATLFGTLQVLLGRLADQTGVVLGCPLAGQAELDDVVLAGHCVSFLPVRAPFTMETPIGEHIKSIKTRAMAAFDQPGSTYGAIIKALDLPRDPGRKPLTNIQFNLERLGEALDFGPVQANLQVNPKAAANFDLFFNLIEGANGLRIEVDYSTELFDRTTIERWIRNFRQILRAFVADPAVAIGDIDILDVEEREWLGARNLRLPRLPAALSVPAMFSQMAASHQQALAILEGERSMSYGDLDSQSNRLARWLQKQGIGKGSLVALIAGRSIDTLTAIVAVLKAGAAYMPLDSTYPAARLASFLNSANPALVLADGIGFPAIEVMACDIACLPLAKAIEDSSSMTDAPLSVNVQADDPAYVMCTTGSTGAPKGVIVPHRAIIRLVSDQDFISFGSEEVFLLMAPLAFDASTLEIWGALLHGGTVAIMPCARPSLDDIAKTIRECGVTTAWFTAGLFNTIIDERIDAFAPLRQVLAGGDVLSPSHVAKFRSAHPTIRLVNGYGPTENTTFSTCYVVPASVARDAAIPIGTPIAHSSVYIVDARGRLRPRGATGELVVGGEGVALGYLGQSDHAESGFVNELPEITEKRLYRTGDLARWRPDGTIDFLGRIDKQVKINGFRVELGEIETLLRTVEGIRDAAVVVSEGAANAKQIHAFVIAPDMDEPALAEQVRHVLADRLPKVMHPRSIHLLAALPGNDNGKVDRSALLAELKSRQAAGIQRVPDVVISQAMSKTECRIANIWKEVLDVEDIKPGDAIFDLGADSLQIFRIGARMAAQGMELENRELLANPTLAKLARLVDGGASRIAAPVSPLKPLSAYRRGSAA
ncbi:MAG: non-ribosomal peptide synthetase [Croceicoccus sp.]|nr:non-ribosomal peptide synthetase [Croceicoccus sp.]